MIILIKYLIREVIAYVYMKINKTKTIMRQRTESNVKILTNSMHECNTALVIRSVIQFFLLFICHFDMHVWFSSFLA